MAKRLRTMNDKTHENKRPRNSTSSSATDKLPEKLSPSGIKSYGLAPGCGILDVGERMPRPTEEEMRHMARRGAASMNIDGHNISFEESLRIVKQFYDSDQPEVIRALIKKADAENRSDCEVFREFFGPPGPPKQLKDLM